MDRTSGRLRIIMAGALGLTCFCRVVVAGAQSEHANARQLVEAMIAQEQKACHDRIYYSYLSEERSDRTKGHLWTERMVDTDWGTVRYLIASDGRALTSDQVSREKSRLTQETADPESYKRQELKEDESEQSQRMLAVLPRAFSLDLLSESTQEIRIGYTPDPAFAPQTMEERALHGMTGVLVLDKESLRLRKLEGRAPSDVSLGFGPFATLRAGSNFDTSRERLQDSVWRTTSVRTSVQGKALLLKTIARQQEYRHSEFQRVPANLSIEGAVALIER